MTQQRRAGKYPAEMRDRAVRMVFEAEQHCDSQSDAIRSVADKLGPTAETIRKWVRRVEIDEGCRPGLTIDERVRLKQLERENTVVFDGEDTSTLSDRQLMQIRSERIGYVFQTFNRLPALTAVGNVEFPMRLVSGEKRESRSSRRERVFGITSRGSDCARG